jgi:uncharacterized protein (TIGR02246 family)
MSTLLPFALLLALSPAPAAPAAESVPLAGDRAKAGRVWQTFQSWLAAYAKGDLPGVMAIFDRDVRFSYQGAPDRGYAELEASYVEDFRTRQPGSEWVPEVEEVYADGRLALVRAVWRLERKTAEGKTETKGRNRSLDLLRRGDDGRWRIFRSFNYPDEQRGSR